MAHAKGKDSRKVGVDVKTIQRIFRDPLECITTETLDKLDTTLVVPACELIEQEAPKDRFNAY